MYRFKRIRIRGHPFKCYRRSSFFNSSPDRVELYLRAWYTRWRCSWAGSPLRAAARLVSTGVGVGLSVYMWVVGVNTAVQGSISSYGREMTDVCKQAAIGQQVWT